ncbi:hypothetical protein AYI74_21620 [Shewanella algae]|uniref:DUF4124 domain-containing protein n=1 Tax=Shewanella algae TaxID=38313 RepID=UPI0011B7AAEA|nr:DUF4124 domain-containing protein [Shewanella algae]QTE85666.1 DUF4124 domain-containing protein [Shewanella algae]TWU59727.1 hypothetical protein AYI74_21620 [Shewanella algae]HEW9975057.1 DUF4124 domain-containing protein [Shewanella algae]
MIRISLFMALLALLGANAASATPIYTWVDENGVTHYSQEPPPQQQATELDSQNLQPARIGTVAPQRKDDVVQETESEKQAKLIKEKDAAQAQAICDKAKFQLDVLITHTRLQRKDEASGEMIKMTEEERQAQIKEQQERIRLFCQRN